MSTKVSLQNPLPLFRSPMKEDLREEITVRINAIDSRIKTWLRIAKKEKIDLHKERENLRWLRKDDKSVLRKHPEEVALLRKEKIKRVICSRIVRKVRKNYTRDIPEGKEQKLKEQFFYLNRDKILPWIQTARNEGVDIAEETNVLISTCKNRLEVLSQGNMKAVVVVYLQQITCGTFCCAQIIKKVFAERINRLAESTKSKDWFDDERVSVVEGIKQDALARLPSGGDPDILEGDCLDIFQKFRANIDLFENDRAAYRVLADQEWVKRRINLLAEELITKAKGDRNRIAEICETRFIAVQLINTSPYEQLSEIAQRAQSAFDMIIERMNSLDQIYTCGFETT